MTGLMLPPPPPPLNRPREIFNDTIPYFSPFRPVGFPRIVTDFHTSDAGKLVLGPADAVATLLYNYDSQALADFFNHEIESFKFTRVEEAGCLIPTLSISRVGESVWCGYYSDLKAKWEMLVEYRVSATSKWEAVSGLNGNGVRFTNQDMVEEMGERFAEVTIRWRKWLPAPGVTVRAWKNVLHLVQGGKEREIHR